MQPHHPKTLGAGNTEAEDRGRHGDGTAGDDHDDACKHRAPELELAPDRVKPWPGNARAYTQLNESNCRDLIDSMTAIGGQMVPVIVRRLEGDPDHDYEVIAGTRRHWAICWLRQNGHPGLMLLAMEKSLTDEEAFLLADSENRARKDVSELERAQNYAAALGAIFEGNQKLMAARLGVSKGWLSKMLTVGTVPAIVLEAFEQVQKVSVAALYPVASQLKDRGKAMAIAAEAAVIAEEQGNRFWDKEKPIPAPEVIRRLKAVADPPPPPPEQFEARRGNGERLLTASVADKGGISLHLYRGSGASRAEILTAVARAIDWVEAQGLAL